MGQTIHEWFDGSSMNYGDITVIKPNGTKTYPSIEKLVESEGLNILYPSWLPENEKIVKIRYMIDSKSEEYTLQSSNPLHSIEIKTNDDLSENLKSNCTEKEIAGFKVYYEETPNFIQANFVYKNNVYRVHANTEDNLFKIIENLKVIN